MKKYKTYTVAFRRKREGKTNYRKRLKLLLSRKPRLVIRKSLNHIVMQIIEYSPAGDKVIFSAHSSQLEKFGWKAHKGNLPSAYLTGLLLGMRAKDKVKEAILDAGILKPVKGSAIYAALKGVIDSGINVPHSKDVLPEETRIKGEHISNYAKSLKDKRQQFSCYIKQGINPETLPELFEDVKKKIMSENGKGK